MQHKTMLISRRSFTKKSAGLIGAALVPQFGLATGVSHTSTKKLAHRVAEIFQFNYLLGIRDVP
jgi:hypothetical protein